MEAWQGLKKGWTRTKGINRGRGIRVNKNLVANIKQRESDVNKITKEYEIKGREKGRNSNKEEAIEWQKC